MREITVKLYQYDELEDKAKERALEWAANDQGMRQEDQWDWVREDAKQIGLAIHTLDDRGPNEGEFIHGALECAQRIRADHGKTSETWKTVDRYWPGLNSNDDEAREDAEHELLHDLLEDYRVMFSQAVEYAYSREALEEDIRANEYEFTEEGKRS